MKIRKGRLKLLLVALSLAIVAMIGLERWYSFVFASLPALSSFSFPLILAFSFLAGVLSFFSPCGLALLPAVMSYNIASFSDMKREVDRRGLATSGLACAAGIVTFYASIGAIFALLGTFVAGYVRYLQYAFALLLIFLGYMMARKAAFRIGFLSALQGRIQAQVMRSPGPMGFYLFGLGYGLAIIGCVGPLVAAVIFFPFFSGNFVVGMGAVLAYALALAIMVAALAYTTVFSERQYFGGIAASWERVKGWGGRGMIVAGIILLAYYQFFELIPMYPLS